ncbi:hypothetical protein PR048_033244 [Dryococelus australis]|uniref:Uncharacterized protein n=1 Tax=Dryococelus australis TaxID=614101 RepID=A0ABQ9G338_9NEOP|nr:hypothetical protein PR048_033244 [Dryococelus australis]
MYHSHSEGVRIAGTASQNRLIGLRNRHRRQVPRFPFKKTESVRELVVNIVQCKAKTLLQCYPSRVLVRFGMPQNEQESTDRKKLEAKQRKIFRKILGPIKENGEYKRRHNHELYTHVEKITDTIRKRRITFYGHVMRMSLARLTNRIITYFQEKKTRRAWFTKVARDLEEVGITYYDIKERIPLKKKLQARQGFQEKPKLKTGKV